MKTVAMALFPDFLLLDMAGPLEVFSIANRYLPAAEHYQILTLGTEPGPLRASNGVQVQTDLLLEQAQADVWRRWRQYEALAAAAPVAPAVTAHASVPTDEHGS